MAERRKIIIPTGANPSEPLPTPHFDREATMTARPVVPLSEQEIPQAYYGGQAARAPRSFWKRPGIIVLIILAAVGLGVAAGLAIGVYRNRTAPVTVTPGDAVGADGNSINAGQMPQPTPTPQARVAVPGTPIETPAAPDVEESNRKASEAQKRDEQKDDDVAAAPHTERPKKTEKADDAEDEVLEDKQSERERRREERKEQRRREREEDADPVRRIERKGREVGDRIQQIFQGPPL